MAPISTLDTMASTMGHSDLGHSLMSFDLPISRRGHFFKDSIFENAHQQFNSTVKGILQRWGETDFLGNPKLCLPDALSRYRQLRTHNLKEEDQAVTVNCDAASQKIVMDVHDFVGGEVKVKVAGERELVVEGRTETKTGDWSVSSNTFHRRFCLPTNTDVKAVSAVLSDDGILTITAPRKVTALEAGHMEVPITREGTQAAATTLESNAKAASSTSKTTETSSSTCSQQQQTQSSVAAEPRGQIIPIVVDASQEPQSPPAALTKDTAMKLDAKSSVNTKIESAIKNISETVRRAQQFETTSEASSPRPLFAPPALRRRTIPISTSSLLPITKKGRFFDDDFFASMRQDFQGAVNEVLGRWGEGSVLGNGRDALTSLDRYRQLRGRNLDVESQAMTVTADQASHKIVMDVHDFVGGEVKVKMAGERELVVEGRTETKTGDWSVSSNTFRRRFCLPTNTDVKAVSAVLSDDGILTITAPRKTQVPSGPQIAGSTIPIQVEGQQGIKIEPATPSTPGTPATPFSPPVAHVCPIPQQQSLLSSTQTDARVSGSVGTFAKKEESSQTKQTSSLFSQLPERSFTPGGMTLPITTRGLFFGDSFFKNTWQDFQEAVSDVVSRTGNSSSDDDLTRYMTLRTGDVKDVNQAVKSTEDEANYKIVVDVQDFMKGGNITVKAVRDRELVVEGHVEQEEGGAKFRKQFNRRFVLPHDIYPESVSSVMSADGVLTITAPKKPSTFQLREVILPIAIEEGVHRTESLSQVATPEVMSPLVMSPPVGQVTSQPLPAFRPMSDTTASVHQESVSQSVTSQASQKVGGTREHIIPMAVEDIHPSVVTGSTQARQAEVSQTVSQTQAAAKTVSQTQAAATSAAQVQKTAASESLQTENRSTLQTEHGALKVVPINHKGAFLNDSFFDDARQRFSALTQQSDARSSLASSRSLLRRNFHQTEQETHVEEDAHALKVVLDVTDFIGGEVKVGVEGGHSLVVEGQTSCEEGTSSSSRTFRRVFSLPRQVDVAAVTSALSSDGVLTIMAPKLQTLTEAAAGSKAMTSESHSRQESQGAGARSLEERNVKEEVKESEGSSSKSFSSSQTSQQQYSSQNVF
ncbi:Protein lethal(2)essential for life [Chionoecetes opilio]|uniref:Protein lethal(2)essential for life n=1 Tax=Chionoecetes opilio TaxID=41210 RepID=A0A8J8WKV1_CHIOP|nr:Protein lethal(2)essential for life [Chionoecetes opilio]